MNLPGTKPNLVEYLFLQMLFSKPIMYCEISRLFSWPKEQLVGTYVRLIFSIELYIRAK